MNYDTMSVDEWLQTFFEAATCDGIAFAGNIEMTMDEVKRELRAAVIREASVGRAHVIRDSRKGQEAWFYGVSDGRGNVPAGDYDLIPEETLQKDKEKVPHEL